MDSKKLEVEVKVLKDCLEFIINRLFKCGKLYETHVKILEETLKTKGDIKKIETKMESEKVGQRGL